MLVFSLFISIFIAKRPPEAYVKGKKLDITSTNKISNSKFLNFKDISKTPNFWSFSIGLLLLGISFSGIKQHYQSYLSVLGYSLSFNANIGSLLALVGVIANILAGFLFDKIKTKYVLAQFGFLTLLSLIFLFIANKPIYAYLFTICYGMTMCMASVWPSLGVSKIFSNENYSVIFGISSMFNTIGSSIGPFLSGVIADTPLGYPAAWAIFFALTIICYSLFIKSVK